MHIHRKLVLQRVGLFVLISLISPGFSAAGDIDPGTLKPGLVTTYRDSARPTPAEVTRLEPTIALAWKAGETAHPRLAAEGGTVRWEGFLNLPRNGNYRFTARLRGKFRLTVGGKEVFAAEVKDDMPALKDEPEIQLESGVHPVLAEFTRLPGAARLEVFWQAGHFRQEPLPYDHLGHLPDKAPAALRQSEQAEYGRFLAEEYACTRCHLPNEHDGVARGLQARMGPDLSRVGERVYAGWVFRWLESPRKLRPGTVMPDLFSPDEQGRVERYAVASYLASLGGPVKTEGRGGGRGRGNAARGETLFQSIGCSVCHAAKPGGDEKVLDRTAFYGFGSLAGFRSYYPLDDLSAKTSTAQLAAYLSDPLKVDPSGRMPRLPLRQEEADALARYLCQPGRPAAERELPAAPDREERVKAFRRIEPNGEQDSAYQKLSEQAQWLELGRRLVVSKRCNSCHTVAPGSNPLPMAPAHAAFADLTSAERREQGCLAASPGPHDPAPRFGFTDREKESLRRFLAAGTGGAGSTAPSHAARVALKRFNCLACHSRDGEGGLAPEMVEALRRFEKADNAEAISPPPLTGTAHKLRTSWMRHVLTQEGRARPWMALRMPQFGEKNVGRLPEAFAALEGTEPDDGIRSVPATQTRIEAGRFLVGKTAFGCVSCHDLAGIPNTGTRGPDLAQMNQRVRYDWYRRWIEEPQRMQPGTRMPSAFNEGKSLVKLLSADPDQQAEAMWAYLALGSDLPLPEGIQRPHAVVLTAADRPVLLRTFMPDAGARALAVGYPGGVSLAFDTGACRVAYAWTGGFLDAAPVWNDRGGTPAKVLGIRFWKAPPGCPWGLGDSQEPPDFGSRAKDAAFGAALADGQFYGGPWHVHFRGYELTKEGTPSFHYRVDGPGGTSLEVSERPSPLQPRAGAGVARHFDVTVPARQTAWLRLGESGPEPRVFDTRGQRVVLDLKSGQAELLTSGRLIVLPQEGGEAVVLAAPTAPPTSSWQLKKQHGSWQILLRLPGGNAALPQSLDVHVWSLPREDAGLLSELLSPK